PAQPPPTTMTANYIVQVHYHLPDSRNARNKLTVRRQRPETRGPVSGLRLGGADFVFGDFVNALWIERLVRGNAQCKHAAATGQDKELEKETAAFHGFQLILV